MVRPGVSFSLACAKFGLQPNKPAQKKMRAQVYA